MIEKYYMSNGDVQLSPNFWLSEFQSKDGADMILLDSDLVNILQNIRDHFGSPMILSSAYRSPEHNANVGGEWNSRHTKGEAADIWIDGVDPLDVAKYAESIGVMGIGWYPNDGFTHIDTRENKSYWKGSSQEYVESFYDY